jgi:hypothetical protein
MKLNLFSLRPGPYNKGIKLVLQHLNTGSKVRQQILFVEAAKLKKKFEGFGHSLNISLLAEQNQNVEKMYR